MIAAQRRSLKVSEVFCEKKIKDSQSWHKALCADCWQKCNCARWDWEQLTDAERQRAEKELAKHPWRPVTYENLSRIAFGFWCLEHPPLKSGITYSVKEIIERQDKIAADNAETRELYRLGDITERGEIIEV
jgi:hypothetical protein